MGRTASTVRRGMRPGVALARRVDALVARGGERNAELALALEQARRAQWSSDATVVDRLAVRVVPAPRTTATVVPLPRAR